MKMQAKDVNRGDDGHWQHPDLPDWPEHTASTEMDIWLHEHRIHSKIIYLDLSYSDQAIDCWLAGDTGSLRGRFSRVWARGFFALSVHKGTEGTTIWLGAIH